MYCFHLTIESLSTDVREPRTATGSRIFSFLERFGAIAFVTSSHRRPTKAFPVRCEEQKCAKKGNIRLPVAVRGSQASVLKVPNIAGFRLLLHLPPHSKHRRFLHPSVYQSTPGSFRQHRLREAGARG